MFDLRAASDVVFLALAIWREARGESHEVRAAVAMSILNRVDRPSWWGTSVTTVLFKRFQYSSLTAPKDPQLTTWPYKDPSWDECLLVSADAIEGKVRTPFPGADSYYDVSIGAPPWTKPARFCGQLGKIRFYDTDHDYEAAVVVANS